MQSPLPAARGAPGKAGIIPCAPLRKKRTAIEIACAKSLRFCIVQRIEAVNSTARQTRRFALVTMRDICKITRANVFSVCVLNC